MKIETGRKEEDGKASGRQARRCDDDATLLHRRLSARARARPHAATRGHAVTCTSTMSRGRSNQKGVRLLLTSAAFDARCFLKFLKW